jgi:mono/diheme cytochrome c family protein
MMEKKNVAFWVSFLLLLGLFLIFTTHGRAQGEKKLDHAAAAMGRASFKIYCGSCHGKEAKGDGPLSSSLRTPPANLTVLSKENEGTFPYETVYRTIDGRNKVKGHGSADMPVWGDAFKTTDTEEQVKQRITELTNFIWSIQEENEE